MCRLAYIPGNSPVKKKQLVTLFNELEKSCGGDGNGYAVVQNGKPIIRKALNLTCESIVDDVFTYIKAGHSVYFHTRKVSIGWKSDHQCHPFKMDGFYFRGVLCHNGTWGDGGVLAKYFKTGSDTATLAHMIGKMGIRGLKKQQLWPKSGVFLIHGCKPGNIPRNKVHLISGDLQYCPISKIWASEFPTSWDNYNETYDVKEGIHDLDIEAPKYVFQQPIKKSTAFYPPTKIRSTGYENWEPKWDQRDSKFDERAWNDYWDKRDRYEDIDPMEDDGFVTGFNGYHV